MLGLCKGPAVSVSAMSAWRLWSRVMASLHLVDARELFEAELARRGIRYISDSGSGRCVVWAGGGKFVVSLDNLARQVTGDKSDPDRVAWFTDQVIGAAGPAALTADGLYWYLEPNDYQDRPDYRAAVSPRLDRVLVHADPGAALIRWMTPRALSELGLPAEAAAERAWSNLDAAARRAPQVTTGPKDGVTLLSFAAGSPSSASLLLAPALREVVSGVVGWPVLAVAPERDLIYLWNARHPDLAARLGTMVVRMHASAPYPLSTELFAISDSIRAIGSYQPADSSNQER
jgi:hypothetical protein